MSAQKDLHRKNSVINRKDRNAKKRISGRDSISDTFFIDKIWSERAEKRCERYIVKIDEKIWNLYNKNIKNHKIQMRYCSERK